VYTRCADQGQFTHQKVFRCCIGYLTERHACLMRLITLRKGIRGARTERSLGFSATHSPTGSSCEPMHS
jgi:hypothetical protein